MLWKDFCFFINFLNSLSYCSSRLPSSVGSQIMILLKYLHCMPDTETAFPKCSTR